MYSYLNAAASETIAQHNNYTVALDHTPRKESSDTLRMREDNNIIGTNYGYYQSLGLNASEANDFEFYDCVS